jgi:hypothetical protein
VKRVRLTLVVIVVASLFAAVPASAQVGPQIEDACNAAGLPAHSCRGPQHLAILAATECRLLGGGSVCDNIDGYSVDDAAVAAASNYWIAQSLAEQRVLDDNEPLQEELWAHTHNSFNAEEYETPTLYGTDPNQLYTIPHQLDLGIRAIEIDLHWVPSIHGNPDAVVVCHGNQQGVSGVAMVHLGCLPTDPLLSDRLPAINQWLDAHPGEVVLLYFENQMQENGKDSPQAHEQAAAEIKAAFGDKIYLPPQTGTCADLPMDISRADIRKAGKQIILTGNCFSGASSPWDNVVFSRGPRWIESGLSYGTDFTPERCAVDRVKEDYPHNLIRHWGDMTGLSDNDPQTFPNSGGGDVTVDDATNMVRCGVNLIGFDLLQPFDARLTALVWSWEQDEPQRNGGGACAISDANARFTSRDCSVRTETVLVRKRHPRRKVRETITLPYESHPYACWNGTAWHITTVSGRFGYGAAECQREGLGTFDVPRSGYTNELLRSAKADAGVENVFVNYAFTNSGWAPGTPS